MASTPHNADLPAPSSQPIAVSIIIPARNEEGFIAESVQSALAQDFSGFEVIVVDNGSTDATADIATALGARVVSEPVPGLPRAREAGRRAARGDLLIYIDADSRIPPDYLARMVHLFTSQPTVMAASNPFTFYDGTPMTNAWLVVNFGLYRIFHALHMSDFIYGGNFAVRRGAMADIGGFDTRIEFYGEDTDLAKRIGKVGQIAFVTDLCGATSARRYLRLGFWKTLGLYFANYVSVLVLNQPFAWPKIRRPIFRTSLVLVCALLFFLYAMAYPRSAIFGKVVYQVHATGKVVALTFDDGPNGHYTEEVLDILDREGVPATFFLVGKNVDRYPNIAADIVRRGHTIGNHSYTNAWKLPFQDSDAVINEVVRAEDAIYRATGTHTSLFRPPHGLRTPWMMREIRARGYTVVTWDDMTVDFIPRVGAGDIAHQVIQHVHPYSIIVLHDGPPIARQTNRTATIAALRIIIHDLRKQGYQFVSLRDLE